MRTYTYLSFCIFLACLPLHAQQADRSESESLPATVSSKPPADQFFIKKEKEVWEALKHKDKAAATRLLADDFVGMYDFGFFNKSEWVKQIDEKYSVDAYTIMNPKVLRPSPTTALLLYTSTCKGTGSWADYCSHTSRISDLWVERNGEWFDLFSQDTTATSSEQETSLSAQALAKEREIQEAQKQGDWAKFADLLSDDLVAIDEDGIRGKKELLEEIRTADFHLSEYKMEDVRTIPEGNGVIVAYKQTHVGTEHGKLFALHIYTHSRWQRRGEKWVLTMFQDSTAKEDIPADGGESDDEVLKAIVANEQKIFEMLKRNDLTAFGNMLPDDLIDVEDDGIHTKAEWLKGFEEQKKSGLLFKDFKMDDLRLVRYSPSAATLVFRETINGTQEGKPFEWHINSSSGYANRNGKWVPILYQDSMAK